MPQVSLYFHLHQPYRLRNFNVFQVGNDADYFSFKQPINDNRDVFQKVAKKSYLPMLRLLDELTDKYPDLNLSFSCSGLFLEQAESIEPEIIKLIQNLVDKDVLDILSETYYHSLSFLYSKDEFINQIIKQNKIIDQLFGLKPTVFRNTELIYANQIAELLADSELEFSGILTEGVDRYLQGHKRTKIFRSLGEKQSYPLLLKHAQLSDDIAFRFSDRSWSAYPLQTDKFLDWIQIYPEDEIVNLFMDFETFGEHQWQDTGIFDFFAKFVQEFLARPWNKFVTPKQVFSQYKKQQDLTQLPVYDVPAYISWADIDRDLTAWIGNQLQIDALRSLYDLEARVLAVNDADLLEDWRRLQTSDHFYYMCTKWSADGDVHAYFSPYDTPFEAYRRFGVVLADLEGRLLKLEKAKKK